MLKEKKEEKKSNKLWKMTRKCMVSKGCLARGVLQTHFSAILGLPDMGEGTLLHMEMYITFIRGNLCPSFRQKGGGQQASVCCFSIALDSK